MRRLSAREEFCLWAGRDGFTLATTEELLACATRLHGLVVHECNGLEEEAQKRNDVAQKRAWDRMKVALIHTKFSPTSGDGGLTVRLCGEMRCLHQSCTGRAIPVSK